MKASVWSFLYLLLLLWCNVKSYDITTCNTTKQIQCGGTSRIAIHNGTESIASNLLEQCNARHQCSIASTNNECVHVFYYCKQGIPTLQIERSSTMHMLHLPATVGVMSEGYPEGIYQNAENINCNLKFAEHGSLTQTEIKFILLDFVSFANTEEFCLSVKDSLTPPFCSGSHRYHMEYGPFNMTTAKPFSFTMASPHALPVRFWFEINVSPEDMKLDHIECISQQAAAGTIITISTVLGSFLLLLSVAFTTSVICWFRSGTTEHGTNIYSEPTENPCARNAEIQVHSEQDQQGERDTSVVNVNEYTSLNTTPASGTSARNDIGNPYSLLGNRKQNQVGNEYEGLEGRASQEPHDYLEMVGDPMELE